MDELYLYCVGLQLVMIIHVLLCILKGLSIVPHDPLLPLKFLVLGPFSSQQKKKTVTSLSPSVY